jgi:16S rRNA C1402 (ribose-2'-O) methylase RsmI
MLRARKEIKGECVLLVAGAEDSKKTSWEDIKQEIAELLRTSNGGAAEMAREIAARHGVSKNKVYREILLLKKKTQ